MTLHCWPSRTPKRRRRFFHGFSTFNANIYQNSAPAARRNGGPGRLAPPGPRPTDRLGRESRSRDLGRFLTCSNSGGGRSPGWFATPKKAANHPRSHGPLGDASRVRWPKVAVRCGHAYSIALYRCFFCATSPKACSLDSSLATGAASTTRRQARMLVRSSAVALFARYGRGWYP